MVKTRPSTAVLPTIPVTAHSGVSSIYIASAESGTGKSTIALGLLHLLAASPARVGVFKPIVGSSDETDYLLDLLLEHTTVSFDDYGQVRGVTYERVDEDPEAALSEIVGATSGTARTYHLPIARPPTCTRTRASVDRITLLEYSPSSPVKRGAALLPAAKPGVRGAPCTRKFSTEPCGTRMTESSPTRSDVSGMPV